MKINNTKNLKKIFLNISLVAVLFSADTDYMWPTNASNTLTAFFGEMRPHRYHLGIDIRTYGKNGDPVFAITDGYIYRLKVSNTGYGNVIYIKHDDNNISLYAHLSRFNEKIQKNVEQLQFKRDSYLIDHLLEPGIIKVSKGDIIGYTGDTGGLSGPHLHFEIRDEINRPLNPLNTSLGKKFKDTLKPQPDFIAFIPLSDSSRVNGFNYIQEFEINDSSLGTNDTLSVIGDFGIAINVKDKVNSQPFNYGIYSIDLEINDEFQYGIKFDKTSFTQNNQIYLERNYELLELNQGEYYQLYKVSYQNNSFIDKKSKGSLIPKKGINNYKITIKDLNGNENYVKGTFVYDKIINPDFIVDDLANGGWIINYKNIDNIDNIECKLLNSSKSINESLSCDLVNDMSIHKNNAIIINNTKSIYNTIEITLNTDKGKTVKHYALLDKKPMQIQGDLTINHNYDGIRIDYEENEFSGMKPSLFFQSDGVMKKDTLVRVSKNKLISNLFSISEFMKMSDISIRYETDTFTIIKESELDKYLARPGEYSEKSIINGQALFIHDKKTFYDDTIIYSHPINTFEEKSIINPFYIGPNAIPFNKPLKLIINLFDIKNQNKMNVCYYQNNKWNPLYTIRDETKVISAEIKRGSIIGVIIDDKIPEIDNVVPRNNATYNLVDMENFEIYLTDDFSGINYDNGINLTVNEKNILTGYNIYQKKILTVRLKDYLKIGKNTYRLIVSDNSNNTKTINGNFYIKE